jgi:hypothetical protein
MTAFCRSFARGSRANSENTQRRRTFDLTHVSAHRSKSRPVKTRRRRARNGAKPSPPTWSLWVRNSKREEWDRPAPPGAARSSSIQSRVPSLRSPRVVLLYWPNLKMRWRSPPVEVGMAQAVLLEARDPVSKVLTHHYGRTFGKVHAVGRGHAAGAPGVKYLFDCLVRKCWTIR